MLHHHFPQLISPFMTDSFAKEHRAICAGKSRDESHYQHQAAPPAPTTSEPPFNALELQETIVALDAVDIVGRVEHYHE